MALSEAFENFFDEKYHCVILGPHDVSL